MLHCGPSSQQVASDHHLDAEVWKMMAGRVGLLPPYFFSRCFIVLMNKSGNKTRVPEKHSLSPRPLHTVPISAHGF